jgi:alkanesulfonate monooxygenase SsuD/methylene tetrahydromethanopterin reductase-like flavin-dependent oxidoreductase (luciferase family)
MTNPAPEFGIHLPVRVLPGSDGKPATARELVEIVETAAGVGFTHVWVTDHIVWFNPWMDCLILLGAVAERAATLNMDLATGVVGLPLRNPVAIAQTFATIDVLSEGHLIVGVGEGSTESDFQALGIPFDERRKMLEDAVPALRALLTDAHVSHHGPYYNFDDVSVLPHSAQQPSPPIYLSSWGAPAGVRRVARLADGWIASAWHGTPDSFADGLGRLNAELPKHGKDAASFPNAVNTMFIHLDSDGAKAHREMGPRIENITREPYDPAAGHYLVGDGGEVREGAARWRDAGAKRIGVWAVENTLEQIKLFGAEVIAKL